MKPVPELPLYLKIADELRARLLQLPADAPLETEEALTEEFGVARGTIRQALNVLVQEGIRIDNGVESKEWTFPLDADHDEVYRIFDDSFMILRSILLIRM